MSVPPVCTSASSNALPTMRRKTIELTSSFGGLSDRLKDAALEDYCNALSKASEEELLESLIEIYAQQTYTHSFLNSGQILQKIWSSEGLLFERLCLLLNGKRRFGHHIGLISQMNDVMTDLTCQNTSQSLTSAIRLFVHFSEHGLVVEPGPFVRVTKGAYELFQSGQSNDVRLSLDFFKKLLQFTNERAIKSIRLDMIDSWEQRAGDQSLPANYGDECRRLVALANEKLDVQLMRLRTCEASAIIQGKSDFLDKFLVELGQERKREVIWSVLFTLFKNLSTDHPAIQTNCERLLSELCDPDVVSNPHLAYIEFDPDFIVEEPHRLGVYLSNLFRTINPLPEKKHKAELLIQLLFDRSIVEATEKLPKQKHTKHFNGLRV